MDVKANLAVLVISLLISSCSLFTSFSHTNKKPPIAQSEKSQATTNITADRGNPNKLVILALSGGGSRAAYLSAAVMLELGTVFKHEGINLLDEVDAISSVSGGSLPAAYYVISEDNQSPIYGRTWDKRTVKKLMKKNYLLKWFGNWFWPANIGKFWFTDYDRSDIMAQTFADNMYDTWPLGRDLKIGDMLVERPYLVLNATNGTATNAVDTDQENIDTGFGSPFTFTRETFETIGSDINEYSLARAVMATATFPAVFNYMTIKDYELSGVNGCGKDCEKFVHIFDGGNADNLGLKSVSKMLDSLSCNDGDYDSLVVILVDAFTNVSGISNDKSDPRNGIDFFIDTNFLEATDSHLSANRKEKIKNFETSFLSRCNDPSRAIFYHIEFDGVKNTSLKKKLNQIKTNFRISKANAGFIDDAVYELITPQNNCLAGIRDLLVNGHHQTDTLCKN